MQWLHEFLHNMEQYGKPYPDLNYIHHIHGQNASCSSKRGAYGSDPLLLDIKGIFIFHAYICC